MLDPIEQSPYPRRKTLSAKGDASPHAAGVEACRLRRRFRLQGCNLAMHLVNGVYIRPMNEAQTENRKELEPQKHYQPDLEDPV